MGKQHIQAGNQSGVVEMKTDEVIIMSMEWKYKINLNDENIFLKVSELAGTECPDGLKELICEANGASPGNPYILIDGKERILGAILSFNEDEHEAEDVFTALDIIGKKQKIPFAVDPFGNYYCYSGETQTVMYWEHEENKFVDTGMSLQEFLDNLYG